MSRMSQKGAVSLFVVIFAMLIITVITVSFLRLMVADQQQSGDTNLSQSAYDSAMAGVEDAKRALIYYQTQCADTPSSCASLASSVESTTCNEGLKKTGIVNITLPGEVPVEVSSDGSTVLNQAYTCVTMQLETENYIGTLTANESQIVPLIGTSGFDTVTVRWFDRDDVNNSTGAVSLDSGSTSPKPLLAQASWPGNRPSVMRTQLIQFGSNFKLSDFDIYNSSSQINAASLFLYPIPGGSVGATQTTTFTGRDMRSTGPGDEPDADSASNSPLPVKCVATVGSGNYACSMSITLPTPIGGGNRTAFLRLTPFYNATSFEVVLSNGAPTTSGSIVKFKDVQPIVDSTGRANDLYRRVQSRVDLFDTSFPYPDAAIDVNGNFCKDFSVTDTKYIAGSCTP